MHPSESFPTPATPTICANCNHASADPNPTYCSHCGQEFRSYHRPFRELFTELLENTLHWDGKFWLTWKTMMTQPGLLTKHFKENKRARYVPPLRQYIFVSAVYFILSSVLNPSKQNIDINNPNKSNDNSWVNINWSDSEKKTDSIAQQDSLGTFNFNIKDTAKFLKKIDSMPFLFKEPAKKGIDFLKGKKKIDQKYFWEHFWKNISLGFFLLMPFFGLLIRLFFYKKKPWYFDCLIFSVHFHSCIFFTGIILVLLNYAFPNASISFEFFYVIGLMIYLYLSLRSFFGPETKNLKRKTIYLSLFYSFSLGCLMLVMLYITWIFM